MEIISEFLKRNLQGKITDLLHAFVKSTTAADTKKINKSVKEASRIVAKAVVKSLKENSRTDPAEKIHVLKKTSADKAAKNITVKQILTNTIKSGKDRPVKLLKENLSKAPVSKKSPVMVNWQKNHIASNQPMERRAH